ncbi:MAG: hypothetical protein GWN07_04360, partial [Actinobacteria bacterium]|nr:hypothetical protein [Actinomycetota bacterium]NIX19108.1 hypothetical protein [Actinomycetota bacterium]
MGCYGGPGSDSGRTAARPAPEDPEPDGGALCFGEPVGTDPDLGRTSEALSIDSLVSSTCTTSTVRDLSEQLIGELECLMPGQMARIDGDASLSLGGAVFPWLQRPAAEA